MNDAPAAYWRLGEATKTGVAKDSTDNDHDGAYQGSVEVGAPGAVDGDTAASFDGRGGQVLIADIFDFAGTAQFSIEAWVAPAVFGVTYRHIVDNRFDTPDGKQGYVLFVREGELSFERYRNNIVEAAKVSSLPPIPVDAFSHVVAVYDGESMLLYVDAVPLATSPAPQALATSPEPFVVGANGKGSNEFYGLIDEVAIYDFPLGQNRIQQHFDAR